MPPSSIQRLPEASTSTESRDVQLRAEGRTIQSQSINTPCNSVDPVAPAQAAARHLDQQTLHCKDRRHLYHGHRSRSLIIDDIDEMTEWRARQRTFDGSLMDSLLKPNVEFEIY